MVRNNKKPLREIIFNEIINDILNGKINAGEKLLESELAEKYKVSRTPVREALHQMEKDGYVEHTINAGVTVIKITSERVREFFDIAALLEGYATEKATEKNDETENLNRLTRFHDEMKRAAKANDIIRYEESNIQFHSFFLDHCRNDSLKEIAYSVRKKMYMMSTRGLPHPIHIRQYIKSHQKIIDAIKKKDANKAGKMMKRHILEIAENLLNEPRISYNL